ESRHFVLAGESFEDVLPMLVQTPREVAGHARVEGAVPLAGEDVDVCDLGHEALAGVDSATPLRSAQNDGSVEIRPAPTGHFPAPRAVMLRVVAGFTPAGRPPGRRAGA